MRVNNQLIPLMGVLLKCKYEIMQKLNLNVLMSRPCGASKMAYFPTMYLVKNSM